MIKDIKYSGYTAVPSDYESPDGQLASALNLIPEDGALKPIFQPRVVKDLSSVSGNVKFIHKGHHIRITFSIVVIQELPIRKKTPLQIQSRSQLTIIASLV